MKRRIVRALTIVFAFAAVTFLLTSIGPQVHAQQGCADFRALAQLVLPSEHPLSDTDSWGGAVWGTLGSEFLTGYMTGNDGNVASHKNSNQATNGQYVFTFVGGDTFTVVVERPAVFNFPVGKAGFGQYKGHATIVAGTGKFQYASGSIYWEAPFIVWTPDGTNYYGRGNETITGTICGVQ
jgi:hypothetical protein